MTSLLDVPFQVIISAPDSQIAFDATVTEQHESKLTITEHPVEAGASVSDHAQKEPDAITINGIVSQHPILLNADTNTPPAIPGGDPQNRVQQAFDEFQRLQDVAALLAVTTEIRVYKDMMIESISVARDSTKRYILDIGLGLRAFRRASVRTVDAPEPIEPAHKPGQNNGRKQKKQPSKAVEEKTSVLQDVINFATGAGG